MAIKIPQYDAQFAPSGGVQVAAKALDQTPVLGTALERFGNAGVFLGAQVTKDINEAKVREVDNQASEAIRGILYNPDNGYLATTGKSAVDGYKDAESQLRGIGEKLAGGLDDGAQRQMFSGVWSRRMESALNSATVHAAQQSKIYNQGQAEARAFNSQQDAILNYGDQTVYERSKNTMLQDATFDKDGEQATMAASKSLTDMHTGIISNMLAQNRPALAREWYAKHETEVSPAARDNILKSLEAGSLKEDSLNLSMSIMAAHPSYDAQTSALDEQFKSGAISAEVHDAALQRLDYAHAKAKQAEGDYNNNMEGAAQDWILRNPGKSVLDMPTNMYSWARGEGRLDALTSFAKAGGRGIGDDALFTDLRFKAADDPVAFAADFRANAPAYRVRLDDQQYNNLLGVATSSESKDLRAQDVVKLSAATVRGINADLRAAGIDTTPKEGSAKATQWQSYQSQLFQALDAETQRNGKALKPEEARKIALGLLKQQEIEVPFWFNQKKMIFEMTVEERAKAGMPKFESIPKDDIARINGVLYRRKDLWQRFGIKPGPDVFAQPAWKSGIETLYKAQQEGVKF
jgi:hypothetical protein